MIETCNRHVNDIIGISMCATASLRSEEVFLLPVVVAVMETM